MKRLLEQLPALKLFFTNAVLEDHLLAAESILEKLRNPVVQLYLEFLDYVLPLFNDLNTEMQAERPKLHVLHKRVSTVLHTLVENYLKDRYLQTTPISDIRVRDPANFLPLDEIYLGGRVIVTIQTLHGLRKQDIHDFRLRCLDFYIEGAAQI